MRVEHTVTFVSEFDTDKIPASILPYTYKVGDLFTTLKSKKTGVIKEIIPNASGSVRVLLEMPTRETRWTTVVLN